MGTKIPNATLTLNPPTGAEYVAVGQVGGTQSQKLLLSVLKAWINGLLDKIQENNSHVEVIDTGIGEVDIQIDGVIQVKIFDGKIQPVTTNDIDLGDSTHGFKDLYLDKGIVLGSDAQGDVYYRDGSGNFTRLAIGTMGQALVVNAGATAPEWATLGSTPSRWSNIGGTPTRTADSTFTSTTSLTIGMPVRYRATAGTWRYGIIINKSGGPTYTYTIMGYPCTALDDDEFQYANSDIVTYEIFDIEGAFNDASSTPATTGGLLYEDLNLKLHYRWRRSTGYLVGIYIVNKTNDSSANSTINIMSSVDNATYNDVYSAPITASTTEANTGVTAVAAEYVLAYGDYLDIKVIKGAAAGDASDLTVQLIFVLE